MPELPPREATPREVVLAPVAPAWGVAEALVLPAALVGVVLVKAALAEEGAPHRALLREPLAFLIAMTVVIALALPFTWRLAAGALVTLTVGEAGLTRSGPLTRRREIPWADATEVRLGVGGRFGIGVARATERRLGGTPPRSRRLVLDVEAGRHRLRLEEGHPLFAEGARLVLACADREGITISGDRAAWASALRRGAA